MVDFRPLSPLARFLLDSFEKKEHVVEEDRKIFVNPIVSKFASWYEKLRNAMEFREDEVILRATIERILKRRLLLGGNGETTAEPLVKELLWARYMPKHEIGASVVDAVKESIDLYLSLRLQVIQKHHMPDTIMNDWIYDLMSSDIQYILNTKREKELMGNFMFHVLKDDVLMEDESEETRNAQVFMAVRKAFDRDDIAFLRYHMFCQYFGKLTPQTLAYTVEHFPKGYREIMQQLAHTKKDRIYTYIKRRTAAFFILEDVLQKHKDNIKSLLQTPEELEQVVFEAAQIRYNSIASRVQRAIIRSVIFILLTKIGFAFAIEGTYDVWKYGEIQWVSLLLNIAIPPLLMVIVSLFLQPPGLDNSRLILSYINELLYEDDPKLGNKLLVAKEQKKDATLHKVFDTLWLFGFLLSFGAVIFVLTKLHFNIVSQFIFVFFLAIVSFLSYRISLIANVFRVGERQGVLTLLVDFFFMPVIRTGRKLTQSISQINIFLFIFDFFIEAPFKSLFAFFDRWFYFLHSKTEELE